MIGRMVELFSGRHVVEDTFKRAGWHTDRVELTEGRDVRDYTPPDLDFVWASPPCTYYSVARHPQIWPDRTLWLEALRVVSESHARFWCIENVSGAGRFWGPCAQHWGAWYLWGVFPKLRLTGEPPHKSRHRSPRLRAATPHEIPEALVAALLKKGA